MGAIQCSRVVQIEIYALEASSAATPLKDVRLRRSPLFLEDRPRCLVVRKREAVMHTRRLFCYLALAAAKWRAGVVGRLRGSDAPHLAPTLLVLLSLLYFTGSCTRCFSLRAFEQPRPAEPWKSLAEGLGAVLCLRSSRRSSWPLLFAFLFFFFPLGLPDSLLPSSSATVVCVPPRTRPPRARAASGK